MGKLYFKYGAMGSSKTASALMCRFNYMQKGMEVLLLKPKIDTRFSKDEVVSRIGLSAPCYAFDKEENLQEFFEHEKELHKIDVVIVDECQFCTKKQIEQLREITEQAPVLCYGLLTNFKGELFEGSKRLVEIADSLQEIKSICECGRKATMNAKFVHSLICTDGKEVDIGADEKYKGMCYTCFKKEQRKAKIYENIIKYLKIFKDKDNAGHWSCDTSADNIVLQKPYVIYDKDVQDFVADFKQFSIKSPEKTLNFMPNAEDLRKLKITDKSFEYMVALISYVLEVEKSQPGLLKHLIEDDTMAKWLRHIKKVVDKEQF